MSRIAAVALTAVLTVTLGWAALAQDDELEIALEGFPADETFSYRLVGDYVVVADDDYCRLLIGATFGPEARYLPEDSVGKTTKAQRQDLTRFTAPGDGNSTRCADVLVGLGGTILPQSLAGLLELAGQAEPTVPSGEGLTLEGSGPWVSGRFRLEGGTYLALVAASGCDAWDALLVDGEGVPALSEPITASDLLEDIEPGVYYWSVTASDCDWSLRTLPEEE